MNAYEMKFRNLTIVPKVDMTGKRYTGITIDSTGAGVAPSAGGLIVGILQEPNGAGEPAQVTVAGVSFGILGGTVNAGAAVEVTAAGKFIALATGKPVGICMVGGAADDIGSILLK